MPRCGLTGATSYLGGRLAQHLADNGFEVIALSRRKPQDPLFSAWVPWTFNADLDLGAQNLDILIHCAWDMSLSDQDQNQRINVAGSIKLFEEAHEDGIKKLLFISTSSVYEGMRTVYGQSKQQVEARVKALGGMIVRPGLIYGEPLGGILLKLEKLIAKLPIVPVLGGGRQKFVMVQIDDLCEAIIQLLQNPALYDETHLVLAHPEFVSFMEILESIEHRLGLKRIKVSCPWKPLYYLLKCMETLRLQPPLKSDSLLSLMTLDPDPQTNLHFVNSVQSFISKLGDR